LPWDPFGSFGSSYGEPRDFDDRQPEIFQVLWESLRNEAIAVAPFWTIIKVSWFPIGTAKATIRPPRRGSHFLRIPTGLGKISGSQSSKSLGSP